MADFSFPGARHETRDPVVEVTVDPKNPLRPGTLRFQLVVLDGAGNESEPVHVDVLVIDTEKPNAVIEPVAPVPYGKDFTLSGKPSFDPSGGTIAGYIWTRIS